MKHTPGPWEILTDSELEGCKDIGPPNGNREGLVFTAGLSNEQEDLANARLIAAAPDLLAAAELSVRYSALWKHEDHCARKGHEPFTEPFQCTCWVQPMIDAITKATS